MAFTLPPAGPLPKWARTLVNAARSRNAAREDASASFTEEDFRHLWSECGGVCALSGLRFGGQKIGTGRAKRPFGPSLDRIDPTKPYTRDNVRVVVAIANFAMNAWGFLPLQQLSSAIFTQHGFQAAPSPEEPTDDGAEEMLLDGELTEPDPEISPFPKRGDVCAAIKALLRTGPATSAELADQLADAFGVSVLARERKLGSGVSAWRNHVAWALVELGVNSRGSGDIEVGPAGYQLKVRE